MNCTKVENPWPRRVLAIAMLLLLGIVSGVDAGETANPGIIVGQPAELSAWAYAYRADLPVQDKPEAWFVPHRLERLDRVYRPISLLLSQDGVQDNVKKPSMLPAPSGVLQSALLWEGRMQLNRVEIHWPKSARCCRRRKAWRSVSIRLRLAGSAGKPISDLRSTSPSPRMARPGSIRRPTPASPSQ